LMARRPPVPPPPPPPARPPVDVAPGRPPTPPVRVEDEVVRFKRKLWVVFHAVEEEDWDRLSRPEYVRLLEEIKREAVELEKKGLLDLLYLRADEVVEGLKRFIRERNTAYALHAIAELLMALPPHIPRL
jgi:hypothetical protein